MTQFREEAHRFCGTGWSFRPFVPVLLGMAAVAALSSVAQAQITAKTLIGDAVKDTSAARYSDIGEAIKRFEKNDPIGARKFLETVKQKEPKLPPIDLMMAKMYFVKGQNQAGLQSLEKTVREVPGDPEPFLLLASQSFNNGQMIQAMALFDKAIELIDAYEDNPRRKRRMVIRARNGRSAVHQRWQALEAAEADLRVWIEADPEDSNAHSRLGSVLFMLGRETDGYNAFVKAKELNKDLPPPYLSAGSLYHQLASIEKDDTEKGKLTAKAKKAYETAYEKNKQDRTTAVAYGEWLAKTGDVAMAEKVLAAGRQAHPGNFQLSLLSGVVAQMGNKADDAEKFYNQTLAIAPGNRDAYNQLALLLINSDKEEDKARAEQIARINAKLNPNSSDVNITLAWVLRNRNKGAEANQAYQKGIRLGNPGPDSSLIVAKLLHEQNRDEAARGLLESALNRGQGIFVNRAEAEALLETLE